MSLFKNTLSADEVIPISGPVTIRDVARAAGVSITTVSRALNGYSDVNVETRKKIERIAAELNYRPSAVARSLVKNRTQTIGLLVSEMMSVSSGHHFMFEVLRGVHDRCAELGYDLILISTSTAKQRLVSYLDFCTERRFEGVVVMGIRLDDPYVHEVVESPLPSVVIDFPLISPHCGYVMTDNVHGAKLAVQHLVQQGHQRIGFVNGHAQAAVSQDRLRGYRDGLAMNNIPYDPALVFEGDFTADSGARGLASIRDQNPDVTAVFFASDVMAIGAMRFAQGQGVRIPDDLALVGFDNIDLTQFVTPSLTTIHQRRYEMGTTAADVLIDMLSGKAAQGRMLAPDLVVRQST